MAVWSLYGKDLRRALGRGAWRPVAAIVVLVALVLAAAAAIRGAWLPGAAAAALALWAGLFIRRAPGRAAPTERRTPMSVSEARTVLGVGEAADRDAVQEAYRRLMRRAHPDLGGTAGLAAQLNTARDVLLARRTP